MFEKQGQHFLFLITLLALVGVVTFVNKDLLTGQYAGLSTHTWLMISIIIPILHQVYGWFVWRTELYHSNISHWFGNNGFLYYKVGFFVFLALRLISICALALSNRGSLTLPPVFSYIFAVILILPSLYTIYCVYQYFGIDRAVGIDHFDKSYHKIPFVKDGMFKYTDNAMYTYGMLILWIPGLLLFSKAALLAAMFSHSYIWVHYYCTELPDIRRIYGKK